MDKVKWLEEINNFLVEAEYKYYEINFKDCLWITVKNMDTEGYSKSQILNYLIEQKPELPDKYKFGISTCWICALIDKL